MDIDPENLTDQDKELYMKVVKLLNFVENVKIVDAPVLL